MTHEITTNTFHGCLARKKYAARELPTHVSQLVLFSHAIIFRKKFQEPNRMLQELPVLNTGELPTADYRQLARSLRNVFAIQKHVRNDTFVEVYSHSYGHFMRQISHVSRFEPFCARNGKITKSKGFSREKI